MDEKEVREAIELMEIQITIIQKIPEYLGLKEKTDKQIGERRTAIEALEKQLPKKVENWNGQASCPGCKKLFGNMADIKMLRYWDFDYCNHCGQKIDWSEE
jgi:hypothetical protein